MLKDRFVPVMVGKRIKEGDRGIIVSLSNPLLKYANLKYAWKKSREYIVSAPPIILATYGRKNYWGGGAEAPLDPPWLVRLWVRMDVRRRPMDRSRFLI